ncbi:MAG: peptidylprolyl isomerase, partial [Bacteroidota bacterium]
GALANASGDETALDRLIAASGSEDTRIAGAALGTLGGLWREDRSEALAERIAPTLLAALGRGDLVTVTTAAPVLADSLFRPFGNAAALRAAADMLTAPEALEARVAVIRAIGMTRGEDEIDYLLTIALNDEAPAALRSAAVAGLNDRLVDGIDVDLTAAETPAPTEGIDWAFLGRLGPAPRLLLVTDRGEITIELDPEAAPQTVQSITRVVREGRYDGVPFHRVLPNFVLQGGDYFRRDGWGGPATTIRSEFSRLRYRTGALGMASSGKDTEGVQFFVTHSEQPHLDGRYTVFGT